MNKIKHDPNLTPEQNFILFHKTHFAISVRFIPSTFIDIQYHKMVQSISGHC